MTNEQLATPQFEQFNQETRHRTDTITWLAEALNGSMRSSFEFRTDGLDLYGEDGGSMREVFDDAIDAAKVITSQKPNLLFELRRRLIEAKEFDEMLAMARGEGKNTMVVISDFPPELMQAAEDVGGYNVHRQQTMMRIITRQPNGRIRMITQSLDRSDRDGLEAIFRMFNIKPTPGELLGQRVSVDLDEHQQTTLPDVLTDVYDDVLSAKFGRSWHAGIELEPHTRYIDTYQFAHDQVDLIEWFVQAKLEDPGQAEQLRFRLAATATERYKKAQRRNGLYAVPALTRYRPQHEQAYIAELLSAEMDAAERRAVSAGMVFSGCGASIRANDPSTESQLSQSGYGNQSSEKTKYKFDRTMHCVSCQAPPKKGEGKKSCGPCGLCRSCDKKFGGDG
jgi:hypothetical protein